MRNKILLFASSFWLLASGSFAQQLPLSNQYTINKFSLSPAYAGTGDGFEIFGTYRHDWVGVPGSPLTKFISADGMVCKGMGLGGTISSQEAGIFRNQTASLSYAYHLKLGAAQTLSFGLALGLLDSHVDVAGTSAQADPVAANHQGINSLVFNGGFGVLYRCKGFHFGISLPNGGTQIKNANGVGVYSFVPQINGSIGYKYSFNNDWTIDPILKISKVYQGGPFYEVAFPIIYKQKVWLAPIYKKTSIAVGIGAVPYKNFIAQYSYEFASMGIMGQSSGTHEITIGWRMPVKKKTDVPAPDSKKPYYQWLNK